MVFCSLVSDMMNIEPLSCISKFYRKSFFKKLGISALSLPSMSKRVFVRNHPFENAIRLQVHIHANETRFYVQGFAQGLVLKQKHKVTWKWLI